MDRISDDAIMKALGQQMRLAVAKQAVASGNLANLDTPGYRTRELDFNEMLSREMASSPQATAPGHLAGDGADAMRVKEVEGLQSRRDGNNVQLDRELLQMSKAATDFSAAQTVLAQKFRMIRYAINEGR